MSRRAGSLTVFLVDASGSMALHRMAAAKSAALRLVAESHTKRDSVALVSIAGDAATVLLPPTRSILAANRRLAELPCGAVRPSRTVSSSRGESRSTPRRRRAERATRAWCSSPTAARTSVSIGRFKRRASGVLRRRTSPRRRRCGKRRWTRRGVWDARGSAFGGGHGESVRGWRADGRGAVEPREGRRARGGREVSQDADGRGPARERRRRSRR